MTLAGLPKRKPKPLSVRVDDALLILCGYAATILAHEEKPWASITFKGTRHEVSLRFDGASAVEAGERFIANLPEHNFRIPGRLVADASVREVDHLFGADERLTVTAVLLLLEDT